MNLSCPIGKPAWLAACALVLAGTQEAHAEPPRPERMPIGPDQASFRPRPLLGVDGTAIAAPGVLPAPPPSRLIFLNDCKPGGCQIYVGSEDSRRNRSTVARRTSLVPEFPYTQGIWDATLACVRETYARFDIQVTDVDPCPDPNAGCTTPHWEVVVAGEPASISYPNPAGGVSPFDFRDCSIIENSITYAFAEVLGSSVDRLCWTIAQETAHSFGLDHELLGADPMTYLSSPSKKRFQDVLADCGEDTVRDCYCRTKQNSVQEILAIFGAAPPSPPTVDVTAPVSGTAVEPGFVVAADIEDTQGIAQVDLIVDGQVTLTLNSPPFAFNAPPSLPPGGHHVEIRATDLLGAVGSDTVDVLIGEPCDRPGDCSSLGETYTCVGGRCVPGPGAPGGLGEPCNGAIECVSGLCATKDMENHCAEPCSPGSDQCPGGFQCLDDGAGSGLCWPGTTGCLGCSTHAGAAGATPIVPIGAGLVIGAILIRRRRRVPAPRKTP